MVGQRKGQDLPTVRSALGTQLQLLARPTNQDKSNHSPWQGDVCRVKQLNCCPLCALGHTGILCLCHSSTAISHVEQLRGDGQGGEATQNKLALPRSCSAPGLSLLEGPAHLAPLRVLSRSDYWLRVSQPQENMELCLALSKAGAVMPAAKFGVHRRLLVTRTGHQGEKGP